MTSNEKNLSEELTEAQGDLVVLHFEISCLTLSLSVLRTAIMEILLSENKGTSKSSGHDLEKIYVDLAAAMVQAALLEEGNLKAYEDSQSDIPMASALEETPKTYESFPYE